MIELHIDDVHITYETIQRVTMVYPLDKLDNVLSKLDKAFESFRLIRSGSMRENPGKGLLIVEIYGEDK